MTFQFFPFSKPFMRIVFCTQWLLLVFAVHFPATTTAMGPAPPIASTESPNIVLIFADDVGYGDLSCYGATHVSTPHLDRLAAQGRRFTDAHTVSAVCSPSRYALLTGEYPIRHGNLWVPIFTKTPLVVDTDKTTTADIARRGGYATACFGKWHLGFGTESPIDWNKPLKPGPLELGFDHYFGVPIVNSHPPFVFVKNHHVVGLVAEDPFVYGATANTTAFDEKMGIDEIGGAEAAHALYDDEHVGETITQHAIDWMKEHADEKFFLYLATTNIHHPFTPAPRFQGTSTAGPYGDFLHELDWIVGEVMQTLDELELSDKTIVIFTSDNGAMLNRGGQAAWKAGHRMNGELLGFKFDAWEGGNRVPWIVRWPAHVPANTVSDSLISNVDIAATVAALAHVELKPNEAVDSVNLLPAFTGPVETEVRDELLIAPLRKPNLALRSGDWVYIGAQGGGGFSNKNVGDHGLGGPAAHRFTGHVNSDIENGEILNDAPPVQLYNLKKDVRQTQNVVRQHPDLEKVLQQRMNEIQRGPTAPHAQESASPIEAEK